METRTVVILGLAGAALAAACALVLAGALPAPWELASRQGESLEEERPEVVWDEDDAESLEFKASDVAGIEATDVSEEDLPALLDALTRRRWEDAAFGGEGLAISGASGKYKVTDLATDDEYTLRNVSGSWSLTKGYADLQLQTASPAAGTQQQDAGQAPAQGRESSQQDAAAQPQPQRQAEPQADQSQQRQEQAKITSAAPFDEAAAQKLSALTASAVPQQVSSRLLPDINAYLSPTGVSVASADDIYVGVAGASAKGSVLKFQVLAKSGANRMVMNCTYDTASLKHAIVLQP